MSKVSSSARHQQFAEWLPWFKKEVVVEKPKSPFASDKDLKPEAPRLNNAR